MPVITHHHYNYRPCPGLGREGSDTAGWFLVIPPGKNKEKKADKLYLQKVVLPFIRKQRETWGFEAGENGYHHEEGATVPTKLQVLVSLSPACLPVFLFLLRLFLLRRRRCRSVCLTD